VADAAITRKALAIALTVGMMLVVAVGTVEVWRNRGRGLLPPRRWPLVPWDWGDIVMGAIIYFLVTLSFFFALQHAGFFRWWYGENPDPTNKILLSKCNLWATVLAAPVIVAGILGWLCFRGVRLWQFGISTWRLDKSIAVAALAWIAVTPMILGINILANLIYQKLHEGTEPVKHPLFEVGLHQAGSLEWILIVLSAVLVAPVLEELLFRGLLLPWMVARPWSGLVVWGISTVMAAMPVVTVVQKQDWHAILHSLWPIVFTLIAGLPLSLVLFREMKSQSAMFAIMGSSLIWAILHANVWPTPVPLFFLGLALGFLRYRCRSLIGPIVLHAMFNAVSTLLILIGSGQ